MKSLDKMTSDERIRLINGLVLHRPLPTVDPSAPRLPGIIEKARQLGVSWGEVFLGQTPQAMLRSAVGRAGGKATQALYADFQNGVEMPPEKKVAANRIGEGFSRGGKAAHALYADLQNGVEQPPEKKAAAVSLGEGFSRGGKAANALVSDFKNGVEQPPEKKAAAMSLLKGRQDGGQVNSDLLSDYLEGVEMLPEQEAAAVRIHMGRAKGGRNSTNKEVIDPITGRKRKRTAVTGSAQAGTAKSSGNYTGRFEALISWKEWDKIKKEWVEPKKSPAWKTASSTTADLGPGSSLGGFRYNNSKTFAALVETKSVRDVRIMRTQPLAKK